MANKKTSLKTKPRSPALSVASGSMIPFVNNKGNVMHLKGSLTIGDLVQMGMTKIRLAPIGSPLLDGEWRDATTPDTPPPNSK